MTTTSSINNTIDMTLYLTAFHFFTNNLYTKNESGSDHYKNMQDVAHKFAGDSIIMTRRLRLVCVMFWKNIPLPQVTNYTSIESMKSLVKTITCRFNYNITCGVYNICSQNLVNVGRFRTVRDVDLVAYREIFGRFLPQLRLFKIEPNVCIGDYDIGDLRGHSNIDWKVGDYMISIREEIIHVFLNGKVVSALTRFPNRKCKSGIVAGGVSWDSSGTIGASLLSQHVPGVIMVVRL